VEGLQIDSRIAQAAAEAARGEGDRSQDEAVLFSTDDFRMYCLKILPCAKRYVHDWVTCPFSHPGEKAKRRDPRYMIYTGIACPSMKKAGACPRGEKCPYAHNVFEYWLHPTRYRTQLCNDGMDCRRRVCFFAHSMAQLRVPAAKPFVAPEVVAVLDSGAPAASLAAPAAAEALRRISSSWQAGARHGDEGTNYPVPATLVEAQLQALSQSDLTPEVVNHLRAGSNDALAGDATLQVRLAGALQALRRSRSEQDDQGALIEMLQGLLRESLMAQQHPGGNPNPSGTGTMTAEQATSLVATLSSGSSGSLPPLQHLQPPPQAMQQQQVQHLYGAMGGDAAQMGTPHAHMQSWSPGGESPHQQQAVSNGWRLGSGGALPQLAEHPEQALQPASSGSGYSDGPPTQDASGQGGYSAAQEQLQQMMADQEDARRMTGPGAFNKWVGPGQSAGRRSLQVEMRPGSGPGTLPRRRSLQVDDWHEAAPNPFAKSPPFMAPLPLPLDAVQTNTPRAYSSMFEGGTHVADAAAAAYGQSLFGQQAAPPPTRYMQQSPVSGRSGGGSMNFPPRWPQNNGRSQFTRQSLDSMHPQQGPHRHSTELLQPATEAYAARLSLDVNNTYSPDAFHSVGRSSNTLSEPGGMDRRGGLVGAVGHTSGGPSAPRQLSPSHNAALASEMLGGLTLHDRRGGPSPAMRHN